MKSRAFGVAMAIAVTSIVLAGCGGSNTTTVIEAAPEATTETAPPSPSGAEARIEKIEAETQEAELQAAVAKKQAAQVAARAKTVAARHARQAAAKHVAEEAQAEEEPTSSEPPSVIGMKLPEAEAELSSAGFRTVAENTDTAFGIVVKSHYTICEETPLGGDTVRVLAQKYGC
jgi:cell division septation protein DedD